ncbi:peptidase S10 serine carboxypeptidase [Epithele typhae]|uniref:peptidase S10 serine carboxypeptidase n=1 Tax=Epithele typhae TaxID=378194 RepID=UPI00200760A8|nr:peptidase S10 serine carboxypeptidase [Epithele typhae]KAH9922311.1 peptidase S10 serine carboxypeptidase [Epithele typhae]
MVSWSLRLAALALFFTAQARAGLSGIGPLQVPLSPDSPLPLSDEGFTSTTVVNSEGALYEQFAHPGFANYRLRLAQPSICDPTVKQYSGYLDISDTRHLFFWFFEARHDPDSAPLMLWLNGGPGCSSTTGLLFENGPCTITGPNSTTPNPHSWTNVANMIFLDQPIGTGFSYASDGSKVDTLADLAIDVYAFLQLFLARFPAHRARPLHIAAESWGGHYGPHIASHIHEKNLLLGPAPAPGQLHIPLASLVLANGLTEPRTQYGSIPEFLCGAARTPYSPLAPDSLKCAALRAEGPVCERMITACYKVRSAATCDPATAYCTARVLGAMGEWPVRSSRGVPGGVLTKLRAAGSEQNPYDLRIPCKDPQGVCYAEMQWVTTWMNEPATKSALGVDASPVDFVHCNMTVNAGFYLQGQAAQNSARLLPKIIKAGIRLLVFAGDTARAQAPRRVFEGTPPPLLTELTGDIGGKVRKAGGDGAGNVTYVQILRAAIWRRTTNRRLRWIPKWQT